MEELIGADASDSRVFRERAADGGEDFLGNFLRVREPDAHLLHELLLDRDRRRGEVERAGLIALAVHRLRRRRPREEKVGREAVDLRIRLRAVAAAPSRLRRLLLQAQALQ